MEKLQQKIGYQFQDIQLLRLALTHCSKASNNNERFEFLGDSILGAITAAELFALFPKVNEGDLTRMKSYLVRGLTLSAISKELELFNHLIVGKSELKSGGLKRDSILEDALEAIIGAVYVDGGFINAKKVVLKIYHSRLMAINPDVSLKDSKTILQEYLQRLKKQLPVYELISTKGKEHNAVFSVKCTLSDYKLSTLQEAKSIKKAEHTCAKILLQQMKL